LRRNVEQYPAAELTPGVLAVRLDAPVYFANVQWMQDKLVQYEAAAAAIAKQHGLTGVQYVVLDLTPVSHMDSMGGKFVEQLYNDYKERGVQLLLSNPSPRVVRLLQRAGVTDKLGREWIFVRVHDAIQYCQQTLLMELGEAPEGAAVRATAARLPGVISGS
jgi:sulfate transporter 4